MKDSSRKAAASRKTITTRRSVNLATAVLFSAAVLYLTGHGAGPLPGLGPAFNPGTGVWAIAKDASLPSTATLTLNGLQQPVKVSFDKNGVASINAKTNHDLFQAMGYLHAKFRLQQMDLMRRQGEGRLSEIVGSKALESDKFELQLGLYRTAEQEWTQMRNDSPAKSALLAYTDGVNALINQERNTGTLPYTFKLLGYQPQSWTPLDSLVIQGIMTQTLDFTDTPLDYALLVKSLGYDKTMQWFPILPANEQHPYDPGPYQADAALPMNGSAALSQGAWDAALDIKARFRALPAFAVHHGSNSNNWAVDGTKTASGKPLMAGDPHLTQTLPAIWYQVEGSAPDYHFSGVSIPGLPSILIGHNDDVSWSLTNVQNQATLYYAEKTDAVNHPNAYYWNGTWRPMQQVAYDIPVKGGKTEHLTVDLTVHGPVITSKGQTMSVDWLGAIPTPDMDVMLSIAQAKNYAAFKSALRDWHAPSQNFVYADKSGNIGLISAGYYPIIKKGDPWLPLPGTGESDVVGTIPFDDIPQVYNPPSHIVFTANQRPVGKDYPFYIGTSENFFDNGYRANEIYRVLSNGKKFTEDDMQQLQADTRDYLAGNIVPKLMDALRQASLTPQEQSAAALLKNWNLNMDADSAPASVWWTFWCQYLTDTFGPWWAAAKVPVNVDKNLAVGPGHAALNEDLEAWTLGDAANSAFSLPDGTKRTATEVMQAAFHETVKQLSSKLGGDPQTWTWGKLHQREFQSLLQIPGLGYGPLPSGGDNWTVNAADSSDGYLSTAGPSWRFIMDWGTEQGEGVYPGGQSENPMSPWYSNLIAAWWNGSYYPMPSASSATNAPDTHAQWDLTP